MWVFSGQSETRGLCDIQQGQLLTSLTTDVELDKSQKDTAESIQAQKQSEESKIYKTARAVLCSLCGGFLGAFIGVVCGSVAGAMVAQTAVDIFGEDMNASVGCFKGGAIYAGLLGGAVGAAAVSIGYPIDNTTFSLFWSVHGGILGARIGHMFGGMVAIVASAASGWFGALCGVIGAIWVIKKVLGVHQTQDLQGQKNDSKEYKVVQIVY